VLLHALLNKNATSLYSAEIVDFQKKLLMRLFLLCAAFACIIGVFALVVLMIATDDDAQRIRPTAARRSRTKTSYYVCDGSLAAYIKPVTYVHLVCPTAPAGVFYCIEGAVSVWAREGRAPPRDWHDGNARCVYRQNDTYAPTPLPTTQPTAAPSDAPTEQPTAAPSDAPTEQPTAAPSGTPTKQPTSAPSDAPTALPTDAPTALPTDAPTALPTAAPTVAPSSAPTNAPTPTIPLPFVMEIFVQNALDTLTLPLTGLGPYAFLTDWGDGSPTDAYPVQSHSYAASGFYTVQIFGPCYGFSFGSANVVPSNSMVIRIVQWGNEFMPTSGAFYTCFNLVALPPMPVKKKRSPSPILGTVQPRLYITDPTIDPMTDFGVFFSGTALGLLGPQDTESLKFWDTSRVTTMNYMFYACPSYTGQNGDLDNWNTSLVTSFDSTFRASANFVGNISLWNTGSGTYFGAMFHSCVSFNRDLSLWDVSNALSLSEMFRSSGISDMDFGAWDVSRATSMVFMFTGASYFKGNGLRYWNVSSVADFSFMFSSASSFANESLANWTLLSATNLGAMFAATPNYHEDISGWTFGPGPINTGSFCYQSNLQLPILWANMNSFGILDLDNCYKQNVCSLTQQVVHLDTLAQNSLLPNGFTLVTSGSQSYQSAVAGAALTDLVTNYAFVHFLTAATPASFANICSANVGAFCNVASAFPGCDSDLTCCGTQCNSLDFSCCCGAGAQWNPSCAAAC